MTIKEGYYFHGVQIPFTEQKIEVGAQLEDKDKPDWTQVYKKTLTVLSNDDVHYYVEFHGPAVTLGHDLFGSPTVYRGSRLWKPEMTLSRQEINIKENSEVMKTYRGGFGFSRRLRWVEEK